MKRGAIVIHKNEPGEIFRVKKLFGESNEFAVLKRMSHPQPMSKFGLVSWTVIVLCESLTVVTQQSVTNTNKKGYDSSI